MIQTQDMPVGPAGRGVFGMFLLAASRAYAAFWRFRFQQRSKRHLDQLDDRLLRDIGLTREIVETHFRARLWRQ